MKHRSSAGIGTVILFIAVLPLSCRTYGGYGSEDATLRQIQAAVESFESDLATARTDLEALQRRAAQFPVLQPVAQVLSETVQWHASKVKAHRTLLEWAEGRRGRYRDLSRTLRGMLADQAALKVRYEYLTRIVDERLDTVAVVDAPVRGGARYHVVPPFFERLTVRAPRDQGDARIPRPADEGASQP